MNNPNEIAEQVALNVQQQQQTSISQSATDIGGGAVEFAAEVAAETAAETVLDTAGDLIGGIFDAF